MLSRVRNNYEKQQKKSIFQNFSESKAEDKWCMTVRGNMDGQVKRCTAANRNTGQELNSPADTKVREKGGDKVPQARLQRFPCSPRRAVLEQVYTGQPGEDPTLQQMCGCPSSQPCALEQGHWKGGPVAIQQTAKVNPRHWPTAFKFYMLLL